MKSLELKKLLIDMLVINKRREKARADLSIHLLMDIGNSTKNSIVVESKIIRL